MVCFACSNCLTKQIGLCIDKMADEERSWVLGILLCAVVSAPRKKLLLEPLCW